MDVSVRDCLPGILPNVHSNIEARHLIINAFYLGFHLMKKSKRRIDFWLI